MGLALRRFAFLGALIAFVALVSGGPRFASTNLAHAQATEAFVSPALGDDPPRLHEGDFSHDSPADAVPGPTQNGYCIDVAGTNTVGVGVNDGFSVAPGTGVVVDSDRFNNATLGDTSDDWYCVIVEAGLNVTSLTLNWTYNPGFGNVTTQIVIPVFAVDLDVIDGVVGGRALICTVGWDAELLTGVDSNTPPVIDNPLDDVTNADWDLDPDEPDIDRLDVPFKDPQTGEWCLAISDTAQTLGIDVTFNYQAVYNRNITGDDQAHAVTVLDEIDIRAVDYSELRHVTLGGQLLERQDANENVIGSLHNACIIPSDSDDILDANDIYITTTGPSPTNVVGLQVFHSTDFAGVPDGTLCFRWTSTLPGEQFISATFTFVDGVDQETRTAVWDTNNDGNDIEGGFVGGSLLKEWNEIERTEITGGGDPRDPDTEILTNSRVTEPVRFNLADGTFISGGIGFTEWVLGGHIGVSGPMHDLLLDGVPLTMEIIGSCGQFAEGETLLGKTVTGISNGGRFDRTANGLGNPDDFSIDTLNQGGCGPGSIIRVEITASYPALAGGEEFGVEWIEIQLEFQTGVKTPRLAWAGQTVTIGYFFPGDCDPDERITFIRAANQDGAFVGGPGITVTADSATMNVVEDPDTGECGGAVQYESEMPGEVDIEAFIVGNRFSKLAFPIFYMAIEDVSLAASDSLVVSERGDLSADVRGWFTGNNPSGRPAETKPDGRQVPADRWILPTDWETLRGIAEHRANWADDAPMPLTNVTFMMQNEHVVNNYRTGVKHGALGWFLLDGTESFLNVNPRTNIPSVLGSADRPRIITDLTDADGIATVDLFGDMNLSFEGCPPNPATGNPYCDVGDVVGHTTYFAVADYPENKGPLPPVLSNLDTTEYVWAGYKKVSIVDTDAPTMKYVVAHLKDRDGFCDALSFSNTLGIPVKFELDAGNGTIVEIADRPKTLNDSRTVAIGTTFDTHDDLGNEMNAHIVKTALTDDECQVWIKVSNSLASPTNVLVTFPAQMVPVPADVRITGLECGIPPSSEPITYDEAVTVTNFSDHPVSLAGFALRSPVTDLIDDWEHLGLEGYLGPGESKTFRWLNPEDLPWIFVQGANIFDEGVTQYGDFARLVWNEEPLHQVYCGRDSEGKLRAVDWPFPEQLPADGEGEIMLDIVIPFGGQSNQPLVMGWNLVTAGRKSSIAAAIAGNEDAVNGIYSWDGASQQWKRFFPGGPAYLNTVTEFSSGQVFWIEVKRPFTLYVPN